MNLVLDDFVALQYIAIIIADAILTCLIIKYNRKSINLIIIDSTLVIIF